jgi:hypothetical protein
MATFIFAINKFMMPILAQIAVKILVFFAAKKIEDL